MRLTVLLGLVNRQIPTLVLLVTLSFNILLSSLSFVEGSRRKLTTTAGTVKPIRFVGDDWETVNNNSFVGPGFRSLRIGAFNMKKFGLPKVNNEPVLKILVKIVMRYDLIAVSEITDRKEQAIKKLMAEVNYQSEYPYHYVVSARVGRTQNKEQYALIYRPDLIQVKHHFVYNDSKNDPFEREPLIAQLILKGREHEVGLVSIHVKPTDAKAEINALVDVQDWIEKRLKIKDVIILGDFNADCQYVGKKAWKNIRLRNVDRFVWLIGDEIDTTVGTTDCAYDRIVISGPFLRNAVIPNSGRTFRFDQVYGLDEKAGQDVSDHFPVEFSIRVNSASSNLIQATNSSHSPNYYFYIFGAIPAIWNFLFLNLYA